jgi:hypothetical protein
MADQIVNGTSSEAAVAAVKGEYTGTGPTYIHNGGKGVEGHSQNGYGVYGTSEVGRGVVAESDTNYGLRATSRTLSAARCSSSEGSGVEGEAGGLGDGVRGTSKTGNGVHGISETAYGVKGESITGRGVAAISDTNYGLRATSRTLAAARCSSTDGNGIEGEANGAGTGVTGTSNSGRGVNAFSNTGQAIYGHSISQAGVVGESDQFDGVFGVSHSPQHAGVSGHNPGGMAGFFEGDVVVTGDVKLIGGNDVAENFSVINTDSVSPGCVMTFKEDGSIESCNKSYDKKVVGVISGAGDYKPGLVLGKIETEEGRMPIALMGKVFCWVDADFGSVEVGDLLTTSATSGHAMKAEDPFKAFGAVIGKALKPLIKGKGLIPILVALQ